MSNPFASTAIRGNVLFVQYSTPNRNSNSNLGNLYAIYLSYGSYPGGGGSTSPSSPSFGNTNNNSTTIKQLLPLYYATQSLPPTPYLPSLTKGPMSVSMVSTSSYGSYGSYGYELLIAFNQLSPTSQPLVVRLSPSGSNDGSGTDLSSKNWNIDSQKDDTSLLIFSNTTRVWLASGSSSNSQAGVGAGSGMNSGNADEGSAIYELTTTNGVLQLQISNVSQDSSNGNLFVSPPRSLDQNLMIFDSTVDPRIVRIFDSSSYDAVIIGKCETNQNACLVFMKGTQPTTVPTSTPFDMKSCFAAANGTLIMAGATTVYSYDYRSGAGLQTWVAQNGITGSSNDLILACASMGSTVYAVKSGASMGVIPDIYSMDLTDTSSLSWTSHPLIIADHGSGGNSGGKGHGEPPKQSSNTARDAGIIVGVLVIIAAFIYMFYWRRKKNNAKGPFRGLTTSDALPRSTTSPVPYAQPTTVIPMQPLGYQQHPYAAQPQPQPVVAAPIRAGSWTAESAAAVATAAINYNAQSSMNNTMPPPTSIQLTAAGPSYSTSPTMAYSGTEQMPIIASSLSVAPFRPFIVPLGSPTMSENGGFNTANPGLSSNSHRHSASSQAGPKQEISQGSASEVTSHESEEDDGSPLVRSRPIALPTAGSSSSMLQPPLSRNMRPAAETMMSPGLANAQLILQQSQSHVQNSQHQQRR
ncbi:hypothetical protein BGZ83_011496 [Gryganskiella cystojenkinii]|nr:hypothetical protein BGZ83_011496 [Gryganskiella cystojenkinii]